MLIIRRVYDTKRQKNSPFFGAEKGVSKTTVFWIYEEVEGVP